MPRFPADQSRQYSVLRLMLAICLAGLLACTANPAAAADDNAEDSVKLFVEKVNEASLGFFAAGAQAEARAKCRALLAWAFDVPAMGKEALGLAWDKATEEERKQYLAAFEDDVVSAYLRRMSAPGTTLTFVGTRPPVEGHQLAASRRSVPGKQDQIWIWWMRPEGSTWRIDDLLLDGHSAVNTAANEYFNVLQNNHGDMSALLAFMRKRAAQ
jgi:ABC-type transporter MlaC component